jgi:hypothetical protein
MRAFERTRWRFPLWGSSILPSARTRTPGGGGSPRTSSSPNSGLAATLWTAVERVGPALRSGPERDAWNAAEGAVGSDSALIAKAIAGEVCAFRALRDRAGRRRNARHARSRSRSPRRAGSATPPRGRGGQTRPLVVVARRELSAEGACETRSRSSSGGHVVTTGLRATVSLPALRAAACTS